MSNDKFNFALKPPADKEIDDQNKVTGQNNPNLFNGLKGLNLGLPDSKAPVLGEANGGLSLNDLANAHLNQASRNNSSPFQTPGLKLNLDFNNLKIGQTTNLGSNLNLPSGQSSVTLPSTKQLPNISLSTLAKQHETNNSVNLASTSGFKIPSLFGNTSEPNVSGLQANNSITKLANLTGPTKPNIDLSSAILTKEERFYKSFSPKKDIINLDVKRSADESEDSVQKLVSSIDLLISTTDTVFDEVIKNEKIKPSPFGHVLCRHWKEKRDKAVSDIRSNPLSPLKKDSMANHRQIKPFLFDVPSPDDIIIAAQSKVFGRRH